MPLWLSALLVLTHILCFAGGVFAYHQIRVLSMRPLGVARGSDVQDRKLKEMAEAIAKKEVKQEAYNYFNRFDKPLEVFEDGPINVPRVNEKLIRPESGFAGPAK